MVPEEFTIQRVKEDRRCTLILAGQLDLASAPTLEEMIVGLCADGTCEIVLRLDDLTYFDTTGLRLLLHGRELCAVHGSELRIVPVGRGAADASSNASRSEKRRTWRKMPPVRRGERLPDAAQDDRTPAR
jgi:anti-anti-sigma factor